MFADQASVAIEQARRAHELADALEQQTATSDVPRIISQSTADLEAVFLLVITRAVRLCGADHGDIIRAMGQLIAEYGGTLEHLAGDGIMVFFNDPVSTLGFEAQTVRCAVGMRERFRELAGGWRRRGYELDLGIGIALGYATLGRVGYEGHFQYNATGNVVILASRLSGEAKGGEILISQRHYAAVEDLVDVGPVRELTLKGFSRPVAAANVVGLKT